MGKDFDHLSEVIAGKLQEVHEERPEVGAQPGLGATVFRADKESNREPLAAVQDLKSDKGQDLNQKETLRMKQDGVCFLLVRRRMQAECINALFL